MMRNSCHAIICWKIVTFKRLRDGIIIRTVAQRKGRAEEENTLIAKKTKRCKIERIGPSSVEMTLVEGWNRQIRKMMEAVWYGCICRVYGYTIVERAE